MNIIRVLKIMSTFHDTTDEYTQIYFHQIEELVKFLKRDDVRREVGIIRIQLILGYGDCGEDTYHRLYDSVCQQFDGILVDVSHGGQVYGSVENEQRFKQLSYIGNQLLYICQDQIRSQWNGLGRVRDRDKDSLGRGYSAFIESDLIWEPSVVVEIIKHLNAISLGGDKFPSVIAPMILDPIPPSPVLDAWGRVRKDQSRHLFYDVFAFRKGGVRFVKYWPYHAALVGGNDWDRGLLQMDSVGSFVMGHDEAFMRGRFRGEDQGPGWQAIVDFCTSLREGGCSVMCDPSLLVIHPFPPKTKTAGRAVPLR